MNPSVYLPRRAARSRFVALRGLRHHVLEWGEPAPGRVPLVMAHGWMDVGASFQFVVDAFAEERHVLAFDWRGFGQTDPGGGDGYWFPDYLADLDALLDCAELGLAGRVVDLLGHSMGGNVAMLYAGVRAQRVRRLVNLEGFGMPRVPSELAPRQYEKWLDQLREPARLKPYDDLAAVAARLRETNPLLAEDKAAWLATHWAAPLPGGGYALRADPAHKRINPVLYRVEEVLACWKRITAPLLWVEGDRTDVAKWWGHRYPRAEFEERLAVVPRVERCALSPAGHMLHHDQPEALAERLEAFLR
ncbi:MAG: alpha/beta fold hydrolase [Piscinibacter sp.]|uniref:alpha/beta fold hydrolase n=1 Tax=Piscinibacter TaxID=1114981 RepID=UPI000FDD9375|nr:MULTISPECIES: alpha/beta hydrolase [Piscinibacter]MCW5666427.1 alpha/beta fold hydrolase [Piscinibacter sp.]